MRDYIERVAVDNNITTTLAEDIIDYYFEMCSFRSFDDFEAHYLLIMTSDEVKKHFEVTIGNLEETEWEDYFANELGLDMIELNGVYAIIPQFVGFRDD
jgi:galactitol-specific phosphotransferase system IIB component